MILFKQPRIYDPRSITVEPVGITGLETYEGEPSEAVYIEVTTLNVLSKIAVDYSGAIEVALDDQFTEMATVLPRGYSGNLYVRLSGTFAGEISENITMTAYGHRPCIINVHGYVAGNLVAPIAKEATDVTPESFKASWNGVPYEAWYLVDVATDEAFTDIVIEGMKSFELSVAILGLNPAVSYYYRVRAANKYGTSGNSNIITVMMPADIVLEATIGDPVDIWIGANEDIILYGIDGAVISDDIGGIYEDKLLLGSGNIHRVWVQGTEGGIIRVHSKAFVGAIEYMGEGLVMKGITGMPLTRIRLAGGLLEGDVTAPAEQDGKHFYRWEDYTGGLIQHDPTITIAPDTLYDMKARYETAPMIILEDEGGNEVSLDEFFSTGGDPSESQSYYVGGLRLDADLVIEPPAGFEVSLNEEEWVANPNTIVISKATANAGLTQIYVRYTL